MKFLCRCGKVIVDQTDGLPYKAEILREQHQEILIERFTSDIVSYFEAIAQGRRREWVETRWGEGYLDLIPGDDRGVNIAILWDLLTADCLNRTLSMLECTQCGRLWVQVPGKNEYRPYRPDSDAWGDTLSVREDEEK